MQSQATNVKIDRFSRMARDDYIEGHAAGASTYAVEAPRASDAIGNALRNAYERDFGLPEEMAAMLRRLNRVTTGPGSARRPHP